MLAYFPHFQLLCHVQFLFNELQYLFVELFNLLLRMLQLLHKGDTAGRMYIIYVHAVHNIIIFCHLVC